MQLHTFYYVVAVSLVTSRRQTLHTDTNQGNIQQYGYKGLLNSKYRE